MNQYLKRFDEKDSKGRLKKEDEDKCYNINPFKLDKIKILNSKALRRAEFKTQVFITPNNKHVRNRLVHTNEVVANSIILSESMGLNTDLCEAIALGHDLGHCPYGHLTEHFFTKRLKKETSTNKIKFHHSLMSIIILELIERKGKGLNLTQETLEGILYHTTGEKQLKFDKSVPEEYSVVLIADKISYLFSDINDAKREGLIINNDEFNEINQLTDWFGKNQRERTKKCIKAVIEESKSNKHVSFSEGIIYEKFFKLLKLMYKKVYLVYDLYLSLEEQKIKRIIDILDESSIEDYLKIMNYKTKRAIKPDKYLITSLLTDNEVSNLELNKITLERILQMPTIKETIPYLLTSKTSTETMNKFYKAFGEISNKRELFNKIKSMLY